MTVVNPGYTELLCEQQGACRTLTLNRPQRRNAMTRVTLAEMLHALEAADEDASVRVLLLRGAGKSFCAGDDLAGMGSLPGDFAFMPKAEVSHAALQKQLRSLAKPVLAVMHGHAFGVGLDLAMAADFRFVDAQMQLRDQRVMERGMHALTGCAWFQPRAMGVTRAMEFLILGEPLSGAKAAELGMVTRAFPAAELEAEVQKVVDRLAKAPTKAIALMKRQIHTGLTMDHEAFMAFAAPLMQSVEIQDRTEGIQAFLEKRPPRFTGQ